jgi:alpha-galactosidase
MAGLDPDRNYLIREINAENPNKKLSIEGKVVSGRFLMENGIRLSLGKDLSSVVLELVAQ